MAKFKPTDVIVHKKAPDYMAIILDVCGRKKGYKVLWFSGNKYSNCGQFAVHSKKYIEEDFRLYNELIDGEI